MSFRVSISSLRAKAAPDDLKPAVCSPTERSVSESAAGAIQHVHESRWYKILLPLVAPLADPAVKRIMNSPAFQVLTELHKRCCSIMGNIMIIGI